MENDFKFKDLLVWRKAVKFAGEVIEISENLDSKRNHFRLMEQLESSSASIALNIAEGKGRYSKKEFKQFLYYSRGSLYKTVTLLNICYQQNWIDKHELQTLESKAFELASMIKELINSIK